MNCGIVVREFVLQSRYYVHFRANTLGKGRNPLILPPAKEQCAYAEVCVCVCVLPYKVIITKILTGGARGVMVIVIGNGHGDTSSNPGRD